MKIDDGSGQGKSAKVGSDLRLWTESITRSEQLQASAEGNSYQVGSGAINLTSANESAILFFENNENSDVVITAVNVTSTKQTGATAGVFLVKIYVDGTALSAGSAQIPLNNNFGSNKTLTADVQSGQEAATITNGVASGAFYISEAIFFHTELAWTLPKGSSIAMSITPAASNTSFTTTVTLEAHIGKVT